MLLCKLYFKGLTGPVGERGNLGPEVSVLASYYQYTKYCVIMLRIVRINSYSLIYLVNRKDSGLCMYVPYVLVQFNLYILLLGVSWSPRCLWIRRTTG